METKQSIENQLSMYASLGPAAYFSESAQELKKKLSDLRAIEIEKTLQSWKQK